MKASGNAHQTEVWAAHTKPTMPPNIKTSGCAKLSLSSTPITSVKPIATSAYIAPITSPLVICPRSICGSGRGRGSDLSCH